MLGRHEGILRYTIGQRRGIGVASGEPLYVVHLDADRARVVVGPREALETHKIYLRNVNWLGDGAAVRRARRRPGAFAKVRSTRPPRPAVLHHRGGITSVELVEGESGIAPGQACVLYSDDGNEARVFGGGFIGRSERGAEAEAMLVGGFRRMAAEPTCSARHMVVVEPDAADIGSVTLEAKKRHQVTAE